MPIIDQAQRRNGRAPRIRRGVVVVARPPQMRGRYRVAVELESHGPRSKDCGVRRVRVSKRE